jgi:exoribonuclease R
MVSEDESQAEVRGRDLMTGLPKTVVLTPEEIRWAIDDVVSQHHASVVRCLAKAPPELAQDFLVRGMYLVGGGGLLRGLAQRIERETQVPVKHVQHASGSRRDGCRSLHRALRRPEEDVHGRPTVKSLVDGGGALAAGLTDIRRQFKLPERFPAEVERAAAQAATRRPTGHRDLTAWPFVTLDPAASTDLDQAFHIERSGGDVLLHYAIADVAWFVDDGGPIDRESWRRGTTQYLPDGKTRLYPASLSEGAASLLPDGPRPAVVFHVRVDEHGAARLDGATRAVIRSRAKLAYDSVTASQLPEDFVELWQRIGRGEEDRGAARVDPAEQEVVRTPAGGYELTFKPRLASEDQNAAMSLATNLAVAASLFGARTGLFRVMDPPDQRAVARLRHTARAFGVSWAEGRDLAEFERGLSPADPKQAAMMLAIRRSGGHARYEAFTPAHAPWHEAVAAAYAHGHRAPAPSRRPLRGDGRPGRRQQRTGSIHQRRGVLPVAAGDG